MKTTASFKEAQEVIVRLHCNWGGESFELNVSGIVNRPIKPIEDYEDWEYWVTFALPGRSPSRERIAEHDLT